MLADRPSGMAKVTVMLNGSAGRERFPLDSWTDHEIRPRRGSETKAGKVQRS